MKTYIGFGFGVLGNVAAGGLGGQFAKKYEGYANAFYNGIVETALNIYTGIGGTVANDKTNA